MRAPERWYFLIRRDYLEEYCRVQGIAGLLDMLRYSDVTVESNAPAGFYMLSAPAWGKHHTDRWKSFDIKIHGPWPSRVGGTPYELTKWAESFTGEQKNG